MKKFRFPLEEWMMKKEPTSSISVVASFSWEMELLLLLAARFYDPSRTTWLFFMFVPNCNNHVYENDSIIYINIHERVTSIFFRAHSKNSFLRLSLDLSVIISSCFHHVVISLPSFSLQRKTGTSRKEYNSERSTKKEKNKSTLLVWARHQMNAEWERQSKKRRRQNPWTEIIIIISNRKKSIIISINAKKSSHDCCLFALRKKATSSRNKLKDLFSVAKRTVRRHIRRIARKYKCICTNILSCTLDMSLYEALSKILYVVAILLISPN